MAEEGKEKEHEAPAAQTEQQPPKRRRKSGWDAPAPTPSTAPQPAAATAAIPTTAAIPAIVPGLSVPQVTSLPAAVPSTAAAVPGAPAAGTADVMQTQLAIQQKLASFGLLASAQPIDNPLDRRIYVGSLHYELKQADVQALFSCFGTITKLDMSHDPTTNKSKGYCFIEFSDIEAATAATAMDGFELANRKIKVGRPHGSAPGAITNSMPTSAGAQLAGLGVGLGGLGGLGVPGVGVGVGLPGAALGGVSLGGLAASMPAQNVLGTAVGGLPSPALGAASLIPGAAAMTSSSQMRKVKLENMGVEPDDPDLLEEMTEEGTRYGKLEKVDIAVNPTTKQVEVTLVYEAGAEEGAQLAFKVMNGRQFGDAVVKATMIP